MNYNAFISGTGFNVPDQVITNDELSRYMDTSDKWIIERTGIKERRYIASEIGPADLSIPAVEKALENASLNVSDIDMIIFATSTPDYYAPGSGCLLQDKMGFNNIGALDIRVQCSGFIYGLSIAEQYIKNGTFEHILLVGAEVQSTAMDLTTKGRDVAVIFGDGAGAVIVSRTESDKGILSSHIHSEGKYAKELWLETPSSKLNPRISSKLLERGSHFLKMNGREVFKNAVKRFPEVIQEALDENSCNINDIDLLIPHQANLRITQMIQKKLKLKDSQVYSNIHKYGNTTAASVPIALAEAVEKKMIVDNDIILLAAFGSGFAWGSTLIKW
tara:strand:- start:743 stop:1738 length:996 start_codon:yes stop_codon:yes gene_type:complete